MRYGPGSPRERHDFPGKQALYILMVVPLVIPGVILGISILVFASLLALIAVLVQRERAPRPAP